DVALDVAKQLRTSGKVTRGRIGIGIQPVTQELAQSFGLPAKAGAVVVNVEQDSPAAKAGVQMGDVVTKWNGAAVDDANELPRLVAATRPGAPAKMEVFRNGKTQEIAVTVGEIPNEQTAKAQAKPQQRAQKGAPNSRLGLTVEEIPAQDRKA